MPGSAPGFCLFKGNFSSPLSCSACSSLDRLIKISEYNLELLFIKKHLETTFGCHLVLCKEKSTRLNYSNQVSWQSDEEFFRSQLRCQVTFVASSFQVCIPHFRSWGIHVFSLCKIKVCFNQFNQFESFRKPPTCSTFMFSALFRARDPQCCSVVMKYWILSCTSSLKWDTKKKMFHREAFFCFFPGDSSSGF